MSYAIPTNELTLGDIKGFKEKCLTAGIARAKAKGIAALDEELVWREAMPSFDLGLLAPHAAGFGWALDYYVTAAAIGPGWVGAPGLAAVVGNPVLPLGRVAVFYKVYDSMADPMVTAIRFMIAAATTKANFFIQCFVDNKLEPEAWFSEPVVYDPGEAMNIDFFARAATMAAVGEELGFGCFIIERVGAVVS